MDRDVYCGRMKLDGEDDEKTLRAASNYAMSLKGLQRFGEAKLLLRKTLPVTRRVRGDSNGDTLRLKWNYAEVLFQDTGATLDDLREAVTTLEDTAPTARRVLGIAHPITKGIEDALQKARAARDANETPPGST